MGRPLKIQKYSAMSGIFYDNTDQGTTAKAVALDQGYPPFAAPTSMDVATATVPAGTTPPWLGVVGGLRGGAVSTTYPVVECQVNIALPSGSGAGVANGAIIRQKGNRKFFVVDYTSLADEDIVSGAAYMIATVGSTNWQLFGAPAGAGVGTIFTATANGSNSGNGTAYLVGTCVLVNDGTPTAGNMAISFSSGDSTAQYISKITNRFIQDFTGGETGGVANTGDVWAETEVQGNKLYDANFFTDEGVEAKSGADVATWGTNGSVQSTTGNLDLAIVENYTS